MNSPLTLENWLREFKWVAPAITVVWYDIGKAERPKLQQTLLSSQASKSQVGVGWEVVITTYNVAQQDGKSGKFLRTVKWNVGAIRSIYNSVLNKGCLRH
jgi:SWI/SNF-related matrix-associated actin-dependent regulator of chromatin subfamily A containing DEAD/H box 1